MFKFQGTDFEKTFQIPELILGKYTFSFKLEGKEPNKFTLLESKVTSSDSGSPDCIIKFAQRFRNLYIDKFINNGLEAQVVSWLFCYSVDVMTNHDVIKLSTYVYVSPELEGQLAQFGITDSGRASAIQDTCTAPPLSYPLVFDPGNVKSDLQGLQRYKTPVRHIGKPTMYIPLPVFATRDNNGRYKLQIDDLYLNEWFIAKRTLHYSKTEVPILLNMEAELVPVMSKWDPDELKQLLVLFRQDYGTNRFGFLELEFYADSNELELKGFYNFSTKYLSLIQQNQFHRERWRGVMKKLLCACIHFFVDESHANKSTTVELRPQPYFKGDLDNPVDLEGLKTLYSKSFGFALKPQSWKMHATVETVLSHCTDQLAEFEDVPLTMFTSEPSLKRKRDPSVADPIGTQKQNKHY